MSSYHRLPTSSVPVNPVFKFPTPCKPLTLNRWQDNCLHRRPLPRCIHCCQCPHCSLCPYWPIQCKLSYIDVHKKLLDIKEETWNIS